MVISWLFFPAPEELCSDRTAHPAWSSQCPGTSQYPTLLEGAFDPWNCLRAVTTEQRRLLVVVQTPQISLTGSFVVLQLGKADFQGGPGGRPGGRQTPPL